MSVVIVGRRSYGRVHAHGGEYAETQFAHIDFIPLFPVGSFWITNEPGGNHFGFPIKLHVRSVAATYLRVWAPAIAALLLVIPSLAATAGGLAVVALSAWSWTWRSRHGARAQQRSDFDRVALGHRCDPAWLTDDMRAHAARTLTARLAERDGARPPDDVARFGARDLDEAILAYGVLRVTSVEHPAAGAAAERLRVSAFDRAAPSDGPYRDAGSATVAGLGASISAAARAYAAATEARLRPTGPRWLRNRWLQLIAIAGLLAITALQIAEHASLQVVDHKALDSARAPIGKRVSATCDRIEDRGWEVLKGGEVVERIAFCAIGTRVLPVVSDDDDPIHGATLEGELRDLPAAATHSPWVQELRSDHELDARSYDVFLRRQGEIDRRFGIVATAACGLAGLIGGALWLRAFRRRRRAAPAA
jgi:hypothetical protein